MMEMTTEEALARAESAEAQLRSIALAQVTLRACARQVLASCECKGTGTIRKPRGFFTVGVECVKCIPIREALATGEIV